MLEFTKPEVCENIENIEVECENIKMENSGLTTAPTVDLELNGTSLFSPERGNLTQIRGSACHHKVAAEIHCAMGSLVRAKNYPCVPALISLERDQYLLGIYNEFGSGKVAADLYRDLAVFRFRQGVSQAPYMSFWAVFKNSVDITGEQFEGALWSELSALSSVESPDVPWDSNFSSNPESPKFCLSLAGQAMFVVGMHPRSPRKARQFPWPALVFNLYEQFNQLIREDRFAATVKMNRARELKYQGSVNPMVEKYGENWEAIQFSGKENPPHWKCPFHRKTK